MEPLQLTQSREPLTEDKSPLHHLSFNEPETVNKRTVKQQATPITCESLASTRIDIQGSQSHFELLVSVLSKPRTKRSEIEKRFIKEALNGVSFFEKIEKEIGEEQTIQLINRLKVDRLPAGKKIFETGDWGEEFYIILKGAVYILLAKVSEEEAPIENKPREVLHIVKPQGVHRGSMRKFKSMEADSRTQNRYSSYKAESEGLSKLQMQQAHTIFSGDDSEEEQSRKLLERYPGFNISKVLKGGDSFGEIALQHYIKRTATVVCKTDTVICTLQRNDYNDLLFGVFERRDQENLKILKQNPLFSHLQDHELNQIYLQFVQKTYQRGYMIYKEGQKADTLYFVKSGEVELTKNMDYAEAYRYKQELNLQGIKKPFEHKLLRKVIKETKPIRIEMLIDNNIFGFEEFLSQQPRSKTATVISSSAQIFEITYQRLIDTIDDKLIREKIKQMTLSKKARADEVLFQALKQELLVAEKTSDINMKEFKNLLMNAGLSSNNSKPPAHSPNNSLLESSYLTPKKLDSVNTSFQMSIKPELDPVIDRSGLPSPLSLSVANSPKYRASPSFYSSPRQLSLGAHPTEFGSLEKISFDVIDEAGVTPLAKSGSPRGQRIKTMNWYEKHEKQNQERKATFFHNREGIEKQTESKMTVARHLSDVTLNSKVISTVLKEKEAGTVDKMKTDYAYDGINLMTFLAPKTSVFAMQKANLDRRFQQEKKKIHGGIYTDSVSVTTADFCE